jgi:predicted transposase YdaD
VQEGAGPRPFDVSVSYLIELDARGWLEWLGLPADGPISSIESDVATVLAEVDKVLRIEGPEPWLAHIEVQASHDPRLPSRLLQYHALLHHRHDVPVETTVVLLRREADGRELTGRYDVRGRRGEVTVSFTYQVIRLWEQPVQDLLNGGLGVLPLAPLSAVDRSQVPPIIEQLSRRLAAEAPLTTADEIWQTLVLLLRLLYDEDEVDAMIRPSELFRETRLYQRIVAEGMEQGRELGLEQGRELGRVAEARRLLISLGSGRLGEPDAASLAAIQSIDDVDLLERLIHGSLVAASWQDLLAPTDS